MQNAAFNPVYRKWEVCKAFVQLLFCKDFDKRSTFAMIRVKEDAGPEQFYWVILTVFCSVETLPYGPLETKTSQLNMLQTGGTLFTSVALSMLWLW